MPQWMSRVDKTQSQVTYIIHFDADNEYIRDIEIVSLTANMADAGQPAHPKNRPFTDFPHFAFTSKYNFSEFDSVERFAIPVDAAKMLK
jgi:hypothetical protein